MDFLEVSKRSIKRNVKDYFLYFISLVGSIIIYFIFVSIKRNESVVALLKESDKVETTFTFAQILLIIFLTIFIFYCNSFFLRKKKKEIALYSLLGIRKEEIAKLLFYETLLVGAAASVLGIISGLFIANICAGLLVKLMGSAFTFTFTISFLSIVEVLITIGAIFFIASWKSKKLIYEHRLVELLYGENQKEEAPTYSSKKAKSAIVLLFIGYVVAFSTLIFGVVMLLLTGLVIFGLIVKGTFLLFEQYTVKSLHKVKEDKKKYWNGTNILSISSLFFRIKGNVKMLALLSLLSAVTLCTIGMSSSMYYGAKKTAKLMNPVSYEYVTTGKELDKKVSEEIQKHELGIKNETSITMLSMQGNIDGEQMLTGYLIGNGNVQIIKVTDYNKLASMLGHKQVILGSEKEVVLLDPYKSYNIEKNSLEGNHVSFEGMKSGLTVVDHREETVVSAKLAPVGLVVQESLFNKLQKGKDVSTVSGFIVEGNGSRELTERIGAIIPKEAKFQSFEKTNQSELQDGAVLLFASVFLGIVFILATGCILYFKQITEAMAERPAYGMLKKIGLTKKEARESVRKQVGAIFLAPFMLAICHTFFAFLSLMGFGGMFEYSLPLLGSIGVYIVIYFGYYMLTVRSYTNTVFNDRK
ncbi:ABC transporter permease [Bacillus sp. L_1B0_8]|uniref:ABC transporter permease n=1 Tax=Bacillus thuringiensis subsp. higo TaxID=132266 RepID=A0A9X6LG45_BACUH|nr:MULTISPECIES: ABC transporter permease [Bacillus]KIQ86200.1 ABC transporter permease [Bacillus sp. L_1B0_5]KIQ87791.1 ABC transporter permease [Bacillus sp. L_1B0_8]MED2802527.1 ABC transporter permease [Bacillus thuringiensis]OUB45485.1 ABC transporter permease [Bacillus thuringiensis serovar higo]PQQ47150.1 ABC transporter permease [Bacillus thuringiensis]